LKLVALLAAAALVLFPASALAKKKHKKPKALGPVVTVTATGNTVSGSTGAVSTAVATCPSGTVVIGGGFSAPLLSSTSQIGVVDSYRTAPGSWTVSAVELGGSGAVTADAYCRRTTKSITDVAATGTVPGGTATSGSAAATCPAGTQLVAGGFQSSRGPTPAALALPLTNMASGSTWTLVSVNNATTAQTITAHAYCLAGIRAPTLVSSQTSATLAQFQTVQATSPSCPIPKKGKKSKKGKKKKKPGQLLSAGGFSTPAPTSMPFPLFVNSSAGASGWVATAINASGPSGSISVTSQGICV
jgi:hypothetical protein